VAAANVPADVPSRLIVNGCVGVLGPGASCALNLSFAPSGIGQRNGSVTIATDVEDAPSMNVIIVGVGVGPPGPPRNAVASLQGSQVGVQFDPPVADGGAGITSYSVSSNPPGGGGSASASPIFVTGLANGVSYTFTVTATNAHGPGPASQPSNSITASTGQSPAITSTTGTTFTVASAGTFTVTATGDPASTLSVSGVLPSGVTFVPATGVLSGTPALGTVGDYPLSITAANGTLPNAVQNFTLTIGKASQTITFGGITGKTFGDALTVSATATSGLGALFSSSTSGVCTVAGSTVTMVGVGTCTINANQPGNTNYNAAPQVSQSFAVAKAAQTITFAAIGNKTIGDPAFTVSATASSNLAVVFSSLTGSTCTLSGTTVTLVAVGTCTVAANQVGDANYLGAAQVTRSFQIGALGTFALTVVKTGSGAGTVSSNVVGIDCGTTCSFNFNSGTVVTLSAVATNGSVFAGWSGACTGTGSCQVTMNAAMSVTATFSLGLNALTVTKAGSGAGSVTSNVAGINCGATCSANFNPGTVVTLSAAAANDSVFTGWSGACSGTGSCMVTMDSAKAVTATFDGNPQRLFNISTRGKVLTGEDVMIGGFVIEGSGNKTVAIVATGPSLTAFGIANALANPMLTLVRSSDQSVIATNDNWGSAANAAQLQAAGFAPNNALEPAILVNLPPGAYTAIVSGVGGGTGVALIAVYEVDRRVRDPRL